MADQSLNARFQVKDYGSVVLDKISGKLSSIDKTAQGVGNSLKLIKLDSIINLGERAYRAGEQIYGMAKRVASSLNDIDRLSKIAGMTSDQFQKMTYAAKMTDVEAGELAVGIKRLSMVMDDASRGAGEAGGRFRAMGISVTDSSGNLKPLDKVMGEIADKFAQWEDGPRKIAIAVDIFGRSGEKLIPFLNKGSAGLREFYEEAERAGIVIGKDLVDAGSKMEDQFKRIEARVDSLTKKLVVTVWENFFNIEKQVERMKKEYGEKIFVSEIGPPETRFKLPMGAKTQPPGQAGGPTKEAKAIQYTSSQIFGSQQEEGRWLSWWKAINQEMDHTPDLVEAVEAEIAQLTREFEALGKIALENNEKMIQAWGVPSADEILAEIDKVIAAEEKLGEAAVNRMELQESTWKMATDAVIKAGKEWDNLGQNIMGTLASNMIALGSATEKWGEKFKSVGRSILDTIIQIITRQLIMKSLFESSEGGGKGFLGKGSWIGMIGSVLGGILKHEGGIVGEPGPTRAVPAAAFAFAPRFHSGFMPDEYPAILKRGEGVFTPGQMKAMGGDTHIYNIDARGAQKGVSIEIMRAIKESENKAVIRSVNQVADSKLRGGKFAKIFKD